MGSKTSSQSNQQSSTVADPQAYQDYDQTIRRAKQVSNTPYTAYTGQLTAPTNAQEGTATTALNGLGAVANGYFNNAAYQSGLGAAAVNPTAVNGATIGQYMSPYQSDVVNSTAALLNQQDQIQQQQLTSSAVGSGAFGGDRSGLAAAALAGQQDLANNSTLAGLENQNYSQALSEANTQQQVGLGAAQANRAAVQQNAATLAGIGSASTTAGLGVAGAQLGAGELQQQTQQAGDTAQYGQFLQQQAYPFQTEQYLANIVEGIAPNYGSTTAGTTTTQTSPLNAIIGGATLAGGLAPSMSGLSTGLGSLATGLGNIFTASDRRVKENIAKAGKLFDGQPVYTFNYRGSPVTELGLVAQDVEKKHPRAVMTLGEVKHVDYDAATRAAVDKGHFARGGRTLGDVGFHTLTRDEVAHLDDEGDRRTLTFGDVRAPRASGGVVGVGVTPYSDVDGYVPTSQGLGAAAHMLTSPLPAAPSQPANPIPNFQQFQQAGQGLGSIGSGLGNVASDVAAFSAPANGYGLPFGGGHADGGRVGGLGAVRLPRRGYDGGGVVGADDLVFDPDALGPAQTVQPGLGAVAQLTPTVMAPPSQGLGAVPPAVLAPSQGLGAAAQAMPSSSATGLGAAARASNDNAPVPVAPAPVMTPVLGYQQSDGTVTPAPGLGAAKSPATGLGAATVPPTGLGAAQQPQNGVAAINSASAPTGLGFGFNRAVNRTLGFEGGMNASDTNGTPSNYGINQAANPDIDVTKLTPDQARALYKSRYWDAIGGDNLPGPLAHVAFDTAVMTGPARAQAMIAQSGGDPGKFMDLRDSYLNGLLAADPGKYGKYADAWANRSAALRGDVGAGGAPSGALGYTSSGLGAVPMPPSASSATGLGAAAMPTGGQGLGAADMSKARGLAGVLGFGPGGDGGLFGLSDNARQALISAGAAMMSSTSKSPGIAIGEGISKGLATNQAQQALDREAGLARAKAASYESENQNRLALQGIERDRVKIAGEELGAHLQQLRQEGQNFQSEADYRKALTGNEATRIALERYTLLPGPDGTFRYLDKANPGRGPISATQVPELSAAGPSGGGAGPGGGAVGSGAPAPAGTAPMGAAPANLNGPSALKSEDFMRTGRPTLAAPQGYLPTNWWNNSIRMQGDPVAREAAAAQTKEDVTNAAVAAQKANTALYYSDEMDRNMNTLSKSGLLVPGAAFPERLNLAKSYNLAAGAIGLPTVDENATAAGQSLIKDQTRLASQLTSSLGSREAASVFSSMMAATPGASNTMAGYRGISSSIRVLAQRDVDRNAFIQNYQSRYGSTGEADAVFNTLNPPMNYARQAQAIARVPQQASDMLRGNANDPRAIAAFERVYGAGSARYFTGGL